MMTTLTMMMMLSKKMRTMIDRLIVQTAIVHILVHILTLIHALALIPMRLALVLVLTLTLVYTLVHVQVEAPYLKMLLYWP